MLKHIVAEMLFMLVISEGNTFTWDIICINTAWTPISLCFPIWVESEVDEYGFYICELPETEERGSPTSSAGLHDVHL